MTLKDIAKQLTTAVQTVPNLVQILRDGLEQATAGSTVTVTQVVSSGTKIASVKVDNNTTDLYAPEVDVAHNYSTTEQIIGTWTDGSTLYEKTISFTTGNTDAYLNHVTDIENPGMMSVDLSTSYYVSDSSTINATPYFGTLGSGDSNAFAVLCNKVDGKLRIDYRVGSSAYSKAAVVTVRYTKTAEE